MKSGRIISALLAAALLSGTVLTGCGTENGSGEITVTDQAGRVVTLSEPADSLVSSYYISTALLVALGCEDNLCGIEMKADTRELYKLAAPQLLDLPAVGSGKGINVEETAALSPDLVVLPARLSDSVASFEELGIPVIVVNPETQADFEACVTLLAEVTGKTERGSDLLAYYRDKMAEAAALTADLERPDVYLASSGAYLRTCTDNMYQSDLIEMAGGNCVSDVLTDGYWTEISAEQLLLWNPEYILSVQGADYSLDDIRADTALSGLKAVENDSLYVFPSEIEAWDYPTPSSVLGVLWLTYQLHPEVYTKDQYVTEAKHFYKTYFDIGVTEAQLGLE
ncbi:MAG: ABC transporter substrate-binding protein [Ruminococcaceae bacterium]|nr:ABC transporter substrate-binding protein [Oscillospiraceae bacterium]